jgi:hypothetical protein
MAMALEGRKWTFAVLMLALGLQGCPKPTQLILINNSSASYYVVLADDRVLWPPQSIIRVNNDRKPFRVVKDGLGGRLFWALKLAGPNGEAEYVLDVFPMPEEFVPSTGPTEIYLQLQEDIRLYAVMPSHSLPARILPPQPKGFPISPRQAVGIPVP